MTDPEGLHYNGSTVSDLRINRQRCKEALAAAGRHLDALVDYSTGEWPRNYNGHTISPTWATHVGAASRFVEEAQRRLASMAAALVTNRPAEHSEEDG